MSFDLYIIRVPKQNIQVFKINLKLPKNIEIYGNGIVTLLHQLSYNIFNKYKILKVKIWYLVRFKRRCTTKLKLNALCGLKSINLTSAKQSDYPLNWKIYDYICSLNTLIYGYISLKHKPSVLYEVLNNLLLYKLKKVSEELRCESFRFQQNLEVIRPLGNNKKTTSVNVIINKIIEKLVKTILEAVYEPIFNKYSYGLKSEKGCHFALKKIAEDFCSITWVIKNNYTRYFSEINYAKLTSMLEKKILDKQFTNLIQKILKNAKVNQKRSVLVNHFQYFILNPILAYIWIVDKFCFKKSR